MDSLYVNLCDVADLAEELNDLQTKHRQQKREINYLLFIVLLLTIQSLFFVYNFCS